MTEDINHKITDSSSVDTNPTTKRHSYTLDIILIIISIILYSPTLILMEPFGTISYFSGRYELIHKISFGLVMISCLALYPLIVIALIILVRILFFWPGKIKPLKKCLKIQAVTILALTALFLSPFFMPRKPGLIPFTNGFRNKMKTEADVPAIQKWLAALNPQQCTDQMSDVMFKGWPQNINWPEAVTKLSNLHYVNLLKDENGHPIIHLSWGGAFGHWGLVVGHPTMKTPPSDMERFGEYRLELCKGAYVWHEIQ